jgi:predicted Ser/Thr protein kinase
VNTSASDAQREEGDNPVARPLGPGDPRQIGNFEIIGLLGAGGMGEVYLGAADGQYVAVKLIRPQLVSPERFKREIAILHRVPPGVAPQVLAYDSTAARPWFAAEYVPGITLDEAVQGSGPLPRGALWLLLARTAAQLREIHEAGIVHRDLKPANVMLVPDSVKLIDFGIARDGAQKRLTGNGVSYGTAGFKAPEQCQDGGPVTDRADVYALGAMLVYAASGSESGPDPGPLRRVDAALADLAERCLADESRTRPTAAALVNAARDRELAGDPRWPRAVTSRIAAREDFARRPLTKVTTVPPEIESGPVLGWPPGGTVMRPRPAGLGWAFAHLFADGFRHLFDIFTPLTRVATVRPEIEVVGSGAAQRDRRPWPTAGLGWAFAHSFADGFRHLFDIFTPLKTPESLPPFECTISSNSWPNALGARQVTYRHL